MSDAGTCPSCKRPRAGSLESVSNPAFCWRTDDYCRQYMRDTKPYRERIVELESQIRDLEVELSQEKAEVARLGRELGARNSRPEALKGKP